MPRYSVKVFPGVRVYGGHSRKVAPVPPAFGQVVFCLAVLGAPIGSIYAWVTNGFESGVATFFFTLIVGLVVLVKTAKH
jgi:hypothetical protein